MDASSATRILAVLRQNGTATCISASCRKFLKRCVNGHNYDVWISHINTTSSYKHNLFIFSPYTLGEFLFEPLLVPSGHTENEREDFGRFNLPKTQRFVEQESKVQC